MLLLTFSQASLLYSLASLGALVVALTLYYMVDAVISYLKSK